MDRKFDKLKPAVNKRVLLFLAGFIWFAVGIMLLFLAYSWLHTFPTRGSLILTFMGVFIALLVHHFGFLRIVDRNLDRLLPLEGKKCVFSFVTWKSYLIMVVMIILGMALRYSPIPKPYLSVLYIGIGFALVLSSVRYLRVVFHQLRKENI